MSLGKKILILCGELWEFHCRKWLRSSCTGQVSDVVNAEVCVNNTLPQHTGNLQGYFKLKKNPRLDTELVFLFLFSLQNQILSFTISAPH